MKSSDVFRVVRGRSALVGERSVAKGPTIVLLHAGITDRRSWNEVVAALSDVASVVTYDRRGFGQTPPSAEPFSHVDDLLAILDYLGDRSVWLAGSSMGGEIALDAALTAPARVTGLILLSPAVSGAPEPSLDADTALFETLLTQAAASGDVDEMNRLQTWLWLDGPTQREGRVADPARSLLHEMNALVLANGVPEGSGASGVNAWDHLADITMPVTVACGDLDVPSLVDQSRELAHRLPNAAFHRLSGVAHLPQLEKPAEVAALIARRVGRC